MIDVRITLASIDARLARLEQILTRTEQKIMSTLDDLSKQVAATQSVEASAVALIQGLAAQFAAASNDPAVAALTAQLKASADALAAAVAANTPASAPAPAPAAPAAPASPVAPAQTA